MKGFASSALIGVALLAVLVCGCSDDDPVIAPGEVSANIGSAGGTAESTGGLLKGTKALFGAGILPDDTTVRIELSSNPVTTTAIPGSENQQIASRTVKFSAEDSTGADIGNFLGGGMATITIPYHTLPTGIDANSLVLWTADTLADANQGIGVTQVSIATRDTVTKTVTADVQHFSIFWLMRPKPTTGGGGGGGGGTLNATWTALPTTGAPEGRTNFASSSHFGDFWVFGGEGAGGALGDFWHMDYDFGNPANSVWSEVTATGAPSARHQMGFANGELMAFNDYLCIWGGQDSGGTDIQGGAFYVSEFSDPTNGTWTEISTTDQPSARRGFSMVSSGTNVYIWGGRDNSTDPDSYLNDGAVLDLSTNTWTPMTTTGAPPARYQHGTAVSNVDGKMYIFGGASNNGTFVEHNDLWVYDPMLDEWTMLDDGTSANAPSGRRGMVFGFRRISLNGTDMDRLFVWGGESSGGGGEINSGAFWDLTTGGWTTTTSTGVPEARQAMGFASTGGYGMAIFGGFKSGTGVLDSGASFRDINFMADPDVISDDWRAFPTMNAPSARQGCAVVYVGALIVWGGDDGAGGFLNTGAVLKENQ